MFKRKEQNKRMKTKEDQKKIDHGKKRKNTNKQNSTNTTYDYAAYTSLISGAIEG